MAYTDRLRTGRYLSPLGALISFEFDEVQRSQGKKVAIHELPQQDGASVQDLGNLATRYPMTVYFSGDNCDRQAKAFDIALQQKGKGRLFHPRYGNIHVLPISYTQRESLVSDMRRVVFDVEFVKVKDNVFLSALNTLQTIAAQIDAFAANLNTIFSLDFIGLVADDIASVIGSVTGVADDFKNNMQTLVDQADTVLDGIDSAARTIANTASTLIDTPFLLADSMVKLFRLPAKVESAVMSKITGYGELLETYAGILLPGTTNNVKTAAQATAKTMQIAGLALAVAEVAATGTKTKRSQTITAAESLQAIIDTIDETVEAMEAAIPDYAAPYSIMAGIREIYANVIQQLIAETFELRLEKVITTDAEYNPLTLAYNLHGNLDTLDEFFEQNGFTGTEILIIPRDREVRYYA